MTFKTDGEEKILRKIYKKKYKNILWKEFIENPYFERRMMDTRKNGPLCYQILQQNIQIMKHVRNLNKFLYANL